MRTLVLYCSAVLLLVLFAITGYLRFPTNAEIPVNELTRDGIPDHADPTNKDIPFQYRGGAWLETNGSINDDGLIDALSQREHYLATHLATDGFGDNGEAVGSGWLPRGPQNIGGRTKAILIDPNFASNGTIWAAAATGGVWKSVNGGTTWSASNGMLQNYNVTCLALDPVPTGNGNRVLYAGTGEGFTGVGLIGGGVFKSTDSGVNWSLKTETRNNHWKYVNSIAAATYGGGTVILAAVEGGPSSDPTYNGHRGIMRSTDGGDTWVKEDVGNPSNGAFVAFNPYNTSIAVASVCRNYTNSPNTPKCKAFYSADGGDSWLPSSRGATATPTTSPTPPLFETGGETETINFAFRPLALGGSVIFAQNGTGDYSPSETSKSVNGGAYFSTQDMTGVPTGINGYTHAFWASPNANTLGVNSTAIISGGPQLWRSTNNAQTYEVSPIGNGYPLDNPPDPHQDMQTVVSDPGYNSGSNKKVFVGTDGGIYHTDNILTATGRSEATPTSTPSGWTALNQTYQTTQYYSVAGDGSSGIVFGGLQDNGSLALTSGSQNASFPLGGDGGASEVGGTNCYGQYGGALYRVTNCGTSPSPVPIASAIPDYANGAGITPIIIDPHDNTNQVAFLGVNAVWRTANLGSGSPPTWVSIKANPSVSPSPMPTAARPHITAMALAPSNSNYMWVGEMLPTVEVSGDLWRTTGALGDPSEVTWTKMDDNGDHHLPNRQITKILVDQSSEDVDGTVYVAFGGFDDDNLWRTTDNGGSWKDITGGSSEAPCDPAYDLVGLPCAPIRAIARDPVNANVLYVGTEIGIYVTDTLNSSTIVWKPLMQGPANVSISDLTFLKGTGTLLVGTYGRGLWTKYLGTPTPTPSATGTPSQTPPNDFDGDGRSDLAVVRPTGSPSALNWHIYQSTDGYDATVFGLAGDDMAAGDYDGDGKTDIAVMRASAEQWYVLKSTDSTTDTIDLGEAGDIPVPGDFDGDGMSDEAVYRPSTGYWYVHQSTAGDLGYLWGGGDGDTPVAADFSGDGKADFGIFSLKDGEWSLSYAGSEGGDEIQFGLEADVPVAGYYDGDNRADIAVWRPDDNGYGRGCWYVLYSIGDYESYDTIPWGLSDDIPVPGDYDGDGRIDVAVWRPSTGIWYIRESSNGNYSQLFGASGDVPVGRKTTEGYSPIGHKFGKAPSGARPTRKSH